MSFGREPIMNPGLGQELNSRGPFRRLLDRLQAALLFI